MEILGISNTGKFFFKKLHFYIFPYINAIDIKITRKNNKHKAEVMIVT